MARIIAVAGVRLEADASGLARAMRATVTRALREATVNLPDTDFDPIERNAATTANRIRGLFGTAASGIASAVGSIVGSVGGMIASGMRLALIGTAAGVALAGVTSLATGLVGLIGTIGQAAGVLGLLPAAMLAVKAVSATVTLGVQGMSESFKALASGDAAAFAESLKDLAPAARAFMVEVAKVKPAFDKLQLDVQQRMFQGLSASVGQLATRYLPIARDLFGGLAGSINAAAKEAIQFANNGETAGQVSLLVQDIKLAFDQLVPAVDPLLSAFLDISQVGAEFLPQLTNGFADLAGRFGEFIRNAAASGQLAAFFQTALDTVRQLGQVLVQFGGGLAAVFDAAQVAGGGFLNSLLGIATAFNAWASSVAGQTALVGFFSSMREIIAAVLPVITAVANVIGTTLAPILANMATTLAPALLPVVQAIGQGLQAAAPGIAAFVQGFATLLQAAAPLIAILGRVAGVIGGALGKVLEALAPVLVEVGAAIETGLNALLPVLEPILAQVATELGNLFRMLVPLIPVFFQLIGAVMPLLPPLLQLVGAVLPPLISLVQAVVPIIVELAGVFAALLPIFGTVVSFILGILIPPINLIATVVANVAGLVSDAFSFMSGFINSIFSGIAAFITGIWATIVGIFTGAITAVQNFVRGGLQAIRDKFSEIMGGIGRAVGDGIENVIRFFRELPGKVLEFLKGLARDALEAGKNIVRGIVDGIASLAGAIKDKLLGIVKGAWDAVLGFFGISSPAKEGIWVGEMIAQGLMRGLERSTSTLVETATALAADTLSALQAPLDTGVTLTSGLSGQAGTGTAAGAGGFVLNQTNIMQPGADVTQFSEEVWRRGARDLASGTSVRGVAAQRVQAGMAAPGSVVNLGGL